MALILQQKPSGTDLDDETRSPLKKVSRGEQQQYKQGGTKKTLLLFLAEDVPEVLVFFSSASDH